MAKNYKPHPKCQFHFLHRDQKYAGERVPQGWVFNYDVPSYRRIVLHYTHDGEHSAMMVLTRSEARLMIKRIQEALSK